MVAYYNEIDPFAVGWLKELIKAGCIAPGEIDTRSIEDVVPTDLRGFTQCHFFAGIGVWSYALRCAGWPDDRPVWTGSCPCQPFSAAGKGNGFADERHLWPSFFHLISQCRPLTVFGEQVASKDGREWLDLVQVDLEGVDYTSGALDTCAAGFGSPHIRQRLYWVADADAHGRFEGLQPLSGGAAERRGGGSVPNRLGDTDGQGLQEHWQSGEIHLRKSDRSDTRRQHFDTSLPFGMAYAMCQQDRQEQQRPTTDERKGAPELFGGCGTSYHRHPSPTNGFWDSVDWLLCRDGKWRAVESLSEPLVDGLAHSLGYSGIEGRYSLNPLQEKAENRVMRLKGYGNAIVAPQAEAFIRACMELNP